MKPIISVENLSKQYRIGTKLPYKTFMKALCCNSASFRETLMNVITGCLKEMGRARRMDKLNLFTVLQKEDKIRIK